MVLHLRSRTMRLCLHRLESSITMWKNRRSIILWSMNIGARLWRRYLRPTTSFRLTLSRSRNQYLVVVPLTRGAIAMGRTHLTRTAARRASRRTPPKTALIINKINDYSVKTANWSSWLRNWRKVILRWTSHSMSITQLLIISLVGSLPPGRAAASTAMLRCRNLLEPSTGWTRSIWEVCQTAIVRRPSKHPTRWATKCLTMHRRTSDPRFRDFRETAVVAKIHATWLSISLSSSLKASKANPVG